MRGATGALFMMASFSIGWSMLMVLNWTNPFTIGLAVVFIGLAVFFYVTGGVTMRGLRLRRKELADDLSPAESIAASKRFARGFGVLFGTEFLLIVITVIVCLTVGHFEFIVPLCVLIMGAHFFPFARLFHRRFDYLPGMIAVLVGVGGIIAIAINADPVVWAVMGLGGACCTTMYGLYDLHVIRQATRAIGPLETTTQ